MERIQDLLIDCFSEDILSSGLTTAAPSWRSFHLPFEDSSSFMLNRNNAKTSKVHRERCLVGWVIFYIQWTPPDHALFTRVKSTVSSLVSLSSLYLLDVSNTVLFLISSFKSMVLAPTCFQFFILHVFPFLYYVHSAWPTTFDNSITFSFVIPVQESSASLGSISPASARLANAIRRHLKHPFPGEWFAPCKHSPCSNLVFLNLISVKVGTGTTLSLGWSVRMSSTWPDSSLIMRSSEVSRNTSAHRWPWSKSRCMALSRVVRLSASTVVQRTGRLDR